MEDQLENLKTKKLIEQLAEYKGNGTSMISIYIAAGEQVGYNSTAEMTTNRYQE
jgi:peptide subunit release factor 1 (eRF1)